MEDTIKVEEEKRLLSHSNDKQSQIHSSHMQYSDKRDEALKHMQYSVSKLKRSGVLRIQSTSLEPRISPRQQGTNKAIYVCSANGNGGCTSQYSSHNLSLLLFALIYSERNRRVLVRYLLASSSSGDMSDSSVVLPTKSCLIYGTLPQISSCSYRFLTAIVTTQK